MYIHVHVDLHVNHFFHQESNAVAERESPSKSKSAQQDRLGAVSSSITDRTDAAVELVSEFIIEDIPVEISSIIGTVVPVLENYCCSLPTTCRSLRINNICI